MPITVSTVKGPWLSLGFHIDFKRLYVDLHFIWWIITIGSDYGRGKMSLRCGNCDTELESESVEICPNCGVEFG
jgi:hypothetical protein